MWRAEVLIQLMVNNETWLLLEVQNLWQWLETENRRWWIILLILYDRLLTKVSNFTKTQKQPMVSFPSRWLMMSDSVSITTHIQHLSRKSLCGSLTRPYRESVWETELNLLLTLTTRHVSKDSAASGQLHHYCVEFSSSAMNGQHTGL